MIEACMDTIITTSGMNKDVKTKACRMFKHQRVLNLQHHNRMDVYERGQQAMSAWEGAIEQDRHLFRVKECTEE